MNQKLRLNKYLRMLKDAADRRAAMLRLHTGDERKGIPGLTMQEIADKYDISKGRVSELIAQARAEVKS